MHSSIARDQILYSFLYNNPATTEIYTLSLHDALPISFQAKLKRQPRSARINRPSSVPWRSEEHTSELQSQSNLVCRLLLEKKKTKDQHQPIAFDLSNAK